jgi:hypothetical protein
MRINYSDEENFPGQYELWQANCERSIAGNVGQSVLREMEAALLALPNKRLIRNAVACGGDVCAVGAFLLMRRVKDGVTVDEAQRQLEAEMGPAEDQHYIETDELGVEAGMPHLVAWKLVALNDIELDTVREVAHGPVAQGRGVYKGGISLVREMTPEERYERVLGWVRSKLKAADNS